MAKYVNVLTSGHYYRLFNLPVYRHIPHVLQRSRKPLFFYESFDRKSSVTRWHHAWHTVYVWFWNTSDLFPSYRWDFATRLRNCPSQFTGTYREAGRIEREIVHSALSARMSRVNTPSRCWWTQSQKFVVPGMVPYCVYLQLVVARNVSCCERWQICGNTRSSRSY